MFKLCLALICLGLATQINGESVPAFIFGDKTPSHFPALGHLNGNEFATLIKSQAAKDTLTVVFVENKLSAEDFSQCRLKTQTCFANLNNLKSKSYLSSIEEPVDALMAAFAKQKSITVSGESDLKDATVDGERILFIYFDEVESNEDFHKHDALINKLYNQLKDEYGSIVAIYTGIHPSFTYTQVLKRKVREAEAAPADEKPVSEKPAEEPKVAEEPKHTEEHKPAVLKPKQQDDEVEANPQKILYDSNRHALIALSELKVDNATLDLATLAIESTTTSETEFTVTLTAQSHKIALQTIMSGGTWYVNFRYNDNNEENEKFHARQTVYAFGEKWSFGCGNLIVESSKRTHTIHFVDFQYQPYFTADPSRELVFSDYVSDCVGFFSPAIWGALFVIILLVSILSWGLYMMMDIRTMDRFDDPKGKTITINAQE